MCFRLTIFTKRCLHCKMNFQRWRINGTLEKMFNWKRKRFCNHLCANIFNHSKPVVSKSANHYRARKHKKNTCEDCGIMYELEVHHRDCNVENNDPGNLQTLCNTCHKAIHLILNQLPF